MVPSRSHLGVVAHATQQPVGDARCAATPAGDLPGALGLDGHAENPGGARDDDLEVGDGVEVQAVDDAEAPPERGGEETGPRGGAHEGVGLQRHLHRAGAGAAADHQVEGVVLESGVEDLLDLGVEAMDLVDEEDLPILECGEESREIARPLDDRPRRGLDGDVELGGQDVGETGLAHAGGPEEQDVIERLAPGPSGFDGHAEVGHHRRLADVFVQGPGAEGLVVPELVVQGAAGEKAFVAHVCLPYRPERMRRVRRRRSSNRPSAPCLRAFSTPRSASGRE